MRTETATRSPRFLANKLEVAIMDAVCQRYGKAPHELLGLPLWEYQFDVAVMTSAIEYHEAEAEKKKNKKKNEE